MTQNTPAPANKEQSHISSMEMKFTVGPLPPPDIQQGYNDVSEGFADRIVTLFEKQEAHRHAIEKRWQIIASMLGCLTLGVIAFAILYARSYQQAVAPAVLIGGIATIGWRIMTAISRHSKD